MIGRSTPTQTIDDLSVETLFEETFVVVTATHNPWARRRKVTLPELMNESWIFGEASNSTQALISEVFHAKAGGIPPISVYSTSMNLRLDGVFVAQAFEFGFHIFVGHFFSLGSMALPIAYFTRFYAAARAVNPLARQCAG